MRTIETTAVVTPEHTLTIAVPGDIPVGEVRIQVIIQPEQGLEKTLDWINWKPHDIELVDPSCTFRREDLYHYDGRLDLITVIPLV